MNLVFAVVAAVLAAAVMADDTEALRSTLGSLCNANGRGAFAECCTANNAGANVAINKVPECFAAKVSFNETTLEIGELFVSFSSVFLFCVLFLLYTYTVFGL